MWGLLEAVIYGLKLVPKEEQEAQVMAVIGANIKGPLLPSTALSSTANNTAKNAVNTLVTAASVYDYSSQFYPVWLQTSNNPTPPMNAVPSGTSQTKFSSWPSGHSFQGHPYNDITWDVSRRCWIGVDLEGASWIIDHTTGSRHPFYLTRLHHSGFPPGTITEINMKARIRWVVGHDGTYEEAIPFSSPLPEEQEEPKSPGERYQEIVQKVDKLEAKLGVDTYPDTDHLLDHLEFRISELERKLEETSK